MPRVKCPKCNKVETILRSGFIRKKQRFYCKECNYNFTLNHENRKAKNRSKQGYQTTILDIAKAMGISATTVSRALRDYPDISMSTKEAVKAVAEEMDYHPNLLARSFASNHTQTVGVIIPNLETNFFSSMLGGIQKAAALAGYKVIICQSDENQKIEMENIQLLIDNRVEGLFICHSIESEVVDHLKIHLKKGIPIIHFYRVMMDTDTSKVVAKNEEGAEIITQHLINRGCRRIAIIAGPSNLLITKERLKGYQKALKKHKISVDPSLIAYTDFKHKSILEAMDNFFSLDNKPDGVFSISDRSAIIALKYLKNKGIQVPGQVRVAGFGNDLMGDMVEPSLTTYDVKTATIGERAMHLFLNQVLSEDYYQKETLVVDGEIVIREST
ncbi:LacI family DNA-binding transcriptional regulator [Desertivirga xinjiangensis]|uniref:LacI family DNA-binding transcriptional regulator n=1 Tax=Desertivirga xinjiangensis TaxID=539206 RepID=UPI00210BEC54|nr:substrate-binding domain-containing protein [Pedobacter xinjiangensis]